MRSVGSETAPLRRRRRRRTRTTTTERRGQGQRQLLRYFPSASSANVYSAGGGKEEATRDGSGVCDRIGRLRRSRRARSQSLSSSSYLYRYYFLLLFKRRLIRYHQSCQKNQSVRNPTKSVNAVRTYLRTYLLRVVVLYRTSHTPRRATFVCT